VAFEAEPETANCSSRASASTSICVFMEVLSAARTRIVFGEGKVVRGGIFWKSYRTPRKQWSPGFSVKKNDPMQRFDDAI
jgi:hypothetical protein